VVVQAIVIAFFITKGATMTLHATTSELQDLGESFYNWKQTHPYKRIPKKYWDGALQLIDKYGLHNVSNSIGCAPCYLLRKQQKKQSVSPSTIEFAEIQPRQPLFASNQIQVNIKSHQGISVDISLQGNLEEVFPLVVALFKGEKPCSK
jgi:hypothetical protein